LKTKTSRGLRAPSVYGNRRPFNMLNLNLYELYFLKFAVKKDLQSFHYIDRKDQELLLQKITKQIEIKEEERRPEVERKQKELEEQYHLKTLRLAGIID
jgi:hypothetical protein